jgi:hypothetical protein
MMAEREIPLSHKLFPRSCINGVARGSAPGTPSSYSSYSFLPSSNAFLSPSPFLNVLLISFLRMPPPRHTFRVEMIVAAGLDEQAAEARALIPGATLDVLGDVFLLEKGGSNFFPSAPRNHNSRLCLHRIESFPPD